MREPRHQMSVVAIKTSVDAVVAIKTSHTTEQKETTQMEINLEQIMKYYLDELKNNPDLTEDRKTFYQQQIHRYTDAVITRLESY